MSDELLKRAAVWLTSSRYYYGGAILVRDLAARVRELETRIIEQDAALATFEREVAAFSAEDDALRRQNDALRALLIRSQRNMYRDNILYDAINAALAQREKP